MLFVRRDDPALFPALQDGDRWRVEMLEVCYYRCCVDQEVFGHEHSRGLYAYPHQSRQRHIVGSLGRIFSLENPFDLRCPFCGILDVSVERFASECAFRRG